MTASKTTTVQIVFAPLPEEERDVERSAAKEFAARTVEQFRAEIAATTGDGDRNTDVKIHHMADWDKEQFVASMTSPSSLNNSSDDEKDVIGVENTVVIFLISCGPDGSVHRSVRKTTKWLKEQQKIKSEEESKEQEDCVTPTNNTTTTTTTIVALLGHAVCKTSAEQMADEVYSSGRRFVKSIQSIVPQSSSTTTAPKFVVETQIELEAPEEKFDGWMQSWVVELIGE